MLDITLVDKITIPSELIDDVLNSEPNRVRSQTGHRNFHAEKFDIPDEDKKGFAYYNDSVTSNTAWAREWYKDVLPEWFKEKYDLSRPIFAMVRRQDPGRIFAPHFDYFTSIIEASNGQVKFEDIFRMWIPLFDHKFGQSFCVNKEILYNWQAGDVWTFPNDAYHSTANAGLHPRYTLLCYCVKNARSRNLILDESVYSTN